MSEIKNGGPAFPRSSQGPMGDLDRDDGMTLRDWFAGQARHEDLAVPEKIEECSKLIGLTLGDIWIPRIHFPRLISQLRYEHADAMIAEREKEPRP